MLVSMEITKHQIVRERLGQGGPFIRVKSEGFSKEEAWCTPWTVLGLKHRHERPRFHRKRARGKTVPRDPLAQEVVSQDVVSQEYKDGI